MKDLALILVLGLVVYTQPLLYVDGPVSAGSDSIKHQSAPQSPMLHHSAGSSAVLDSDKRSVIPCLQSATDAGDRGTHGAASGPPGGLVLHGHLDSQKEETAVGRRRRSALYETKCQWEAVKWNWRQPCSVPEPGPNELLSLAPNLFTRKKSELHSTITNLGLLESKIPGLWSGRLSGRARSARVPLDPAGKGRRDGLGFGCNDFHRDTANGNFTIQYWFAS